MIACFRYSLTYYILADNPEMSGSAAIKKSKEMMIGHKWELFVLLFSFFWWYLLCFITFGIAVIYVNPYINATMVNFYEKLKLENNTVTNSTDKELNIISASQKYLVQFQVFDLQTVAGIVRAGEASPRRNEAIAQP